MGELDEAVDWAERALVLSQQIGDHTVEGISHLALARLHAWRGDHDLARLSFDLSIALAEKSGDLRSLAKRHQNAGQTYLAAGLNDLAAPALLRSHEVYGRLDDGNGQAESLRDLSSVYLATGDFDQASRCAEEGLRLARSYGNHRREGQLLIELGRIRQATGDHGVAHDLWQRAAEALHPISPHDEAIALQLLAGDSHVT